MKHLLSLLLLCSLSGCKYKDTDQTNSNPRELTGEEKTLVGSYNSTSGKQKIKLILKVGTENLFKWRLSRGKVVNLGRPELLGRPEARYLKVTKFWNVRGFSWFLEWPITSPGWPITSQYVITRRLP